MSRILAGELVLDYGLYPRHSVDEFHVRELVDALKAGAKLPPVVACADTKRVVDGFHRVRATLKIAPEGEIAATLRKFPDEKSLFLEAVRLNAAHGLRLTPYDQARVLVRCHELEVDDVLIAQALQLPLDRLEKLEARKTADAPNGEPMPIKDALSHLAQGTLTERQVVAQKRAFGRAVFHANQLINAIQGDLIDMDNPLVVLRLQELQEALGGLLAAKKAAA